MRDQARSGSTHRSFISKLCSKVNLNFTIILILGSQEQYRYIIISYLPLLVDILIIIIIPIHTYVCMYAYMHACMHVCVHVCMHEGIQNNGIFWCLCILDIYRKMVASTLHVSLVTSLF